MIGSTLGRNNLIGTNLDRHYLIGSNPGRCFVIGSNPGRYYVIGSIPAGPLVTLARHEHFCATAIKKTLGSVSKTSSSGILTGIKPLNEQ